VLGTRGDPSRCQCQRALECYPMITEPGQEVMPVELHVGSRRVFAAAGFAEISIRPSAES
jgi:hypothetical protein